MSHVTEIIPSRRWRHKSGKAASIYGAVPYVSEAEKADWHIETSGWTWRKSDGTVGLCRPPAATREEAVEIANRVNARTGAPLLS